MALSKSDKTQVVNQFAKKPGDTGSPAVQIALLTKRLDSLNSHFQTNTKDHHSRMGLLRLVGQRRRLLNYLQRQDLGAYQSLIKELGIRK